MNAAEKLKRIMSGEDASCFFIAEAGVNHNGELELAKQLVDAASETGADAVKFQTFKSEKLVTPDAAKAEYQNQNDDRDDTQLAMLKRLELSYEDFVALKAYCDEKGILFMSTPFDLDSVAFLKDIGVEVFKVGSGNLTDLPLLDAVAKAGLPMIISTGMAVMEDIEQAVKTIESAGKPPLAILHCVTNYPTAPNECNLNAMKTIADKTGYVAGWSDHTQGLHITEAAVALGARVIEKHLTLSKDMDGPDHKASMEPDEMKQLVSNIRDIEVALGNGVKQPAETELKVAKIARLFIVAKNPIEQGTTVTEDDLVLSRTGQGGVCWADRHVLVGKKAQTAINQGTAIQESMVA